MFIGITKQNALKRHNMAADGFTQWCSCIGSWSLQSVWSSQFCFHRRKFLLDFGDLGRVVYAVCDFSL